MLVQIPADLSLQLDFSQSSTWHEDLRRQAMCALHVAQPGFQGGNKVADPLQAAAGHRKGHFHSAQGGSRCSHRAHDHRTCCRKHSCACSRLGCIARPPALQYWWDCLPAGMQSLSCMPHWVAHCLQFTCSSTDMPHPSCMPHRVTHCLQF